MPDDDLMQKAIAEAYASAPVDEGIILYTIEFLHPTFDVPARVVRWPITQNEPQKFSLKLENTAPENADEFVDFMAVPFEVTLPAQEDNAPGEFTIKIDNVGHILTEHLTGAVRQRDPVRMIFREYMKHIPEYPQLVYTDFSIVKATVSNNSVEATASMIDWLLRPYGRVYLPGDFPGLVRGR